MPSNLCRPLILLPPIFPSIRVFSNESALHIRWPKYWSFSFNISPSNEHPGPTSSRMDWLHLLAVQETLKSLLQHHSSKASILQCSAFFIVQLSHLYMTTEKTIALTRRTFVDKIMSLLFKTDIILLYFCVVLNAFVVVIVPSLSCVWLLWPHGPLEWVAISFSREFSWPRDWTCPCIGRQVLYHWATWEATYHVNSVSFDKCSLFHLPK